MARIVDRPPPWSYLQRFLSFRDLAGYRAGDLRFDVTAGLAVALLGVPQAVAYSTITGLPPAMGLYAAATPVIVGSLFRSSRHVVTGPTNALSLLVGTAVAAHAVRGDPVGTAVTLAFLVGMMQLLAGLANLGALVDYISTTVVLGYITGAGVLIGLVQLPSLTGSPRGTGYLPGQLLGWVRGLPQAHLPTLLVGGGTVLFLLAQRRWAPKLPGALIVMGGGIVLAWAVHLRGTVRLVADLAPVPRGLPPLTLPHLHGFETLMPMAVAITVLSLVESNAVARDIATRTGQRIDTSAEFVGQGLGNLAAAFFGGYPVSGSVSQSGLNQQAGARSRLSALISGLVILLVLVLLGPIVDLTPVPVLAGLLLVVAGGLVNVRAIRTLTRARPSDAAAFFATLGGTFLLRLDHAIYLGVFISLVLFLRQARMLTVRELVVDSNLRLQERPVGHGHSAPGGCRAIRVLHIEGSLFFGAVNELRHALFEVISDPEVQVLIVRLKRTRALDFTTATVFEEAHAALGEQGRHLLLVGLRERAMGLIERTGIADELGEENLYPTQPGWFVAMHEALEKALELVGEHECLPEGCPLEQYAARRLAL